VVRGADLNVATGAAIDVRGVHKVFRLPHERRTTIKEVLLHPLHKTSYEQQEALRDISFSVQDGEFFGIVGPNGSGKSTLLRILAGIYRQDSGQVAVSGLLSPFIELGVGFNTELTARDNIKINGTLLGMQRKELRDRFDGIVEFAGLERFVDQKLKNFSSGMQVRLAYSIAIQVDFDILLLDEVLAVGDEAFQQKCFDTFARFREERKTIVLVTHDLGAIRTHCDRAMLLVDGNLRLVGSPNDVLAQYDSVIHPGAPG
jgi:ABC-type polysaccharide/polyol phosphate transport system ATPase subunit